MYIVIYKTKVKKIKIYGSVTKFPHKTNTKLLKFESWNQRLVLRINPIITISEVFSDA